MLRVELSSLSVEELKRLLEAARGRGQTAFAQQLLAELDARPGLPDEWLDAQRVTSWALAYEPAPQPTEGRWRPSGVMVATAVLAALVSAVVTWGLSMTGDRRAKEPPPPAEAPLRATVALASVPPIAPPAQTELPQAPNSTPPPVHFAKTGAPVKNKSRNSRCYGLSTASERLVCGYPSLAAQDRQMRAAYDRALAAGADRRTVDRGQATWRSANEDVSDHKALAQQYERRIRELDSAATAANTIAAAQRQRAQDPPF